MQLLTYNDVAYLRQGLGISRDSLSLLSGINASTIAKGEKRGSDLTAEMALIYSNVFQRQMIKEIATRLNKYKNMADIPEKIQDALKHIAKAQENITEAHRDAVRLFNFSLGNTTPTKKAGQEGNGRTSNQIPQGAEALKKQDNKDQLEQEVGQDKPKGNEKS